jgi:hypothetical protein
LTAELCGVLVTLAVTDSGRALLALGASSAAMPAMLFAPPPAPPWLILAAMPASVAAVALGEGPCMGASPPGVASIRLQSSIGQCRQHGDVGQMVVGPDAGLQAVKYRHPLQL